MADRFENPADNRLPPNVDLQGFKDAILDSGYPLQGKVAKALKSDFRATEEWGFIDRETGKHRSLDIFARRRLSPRNTEGPSNLLTILLECKSSRTPYVFFEAEAPPSLRDFPYVFGVKESIEIRSPVEGKEGRFLIRTVSPSEVLGLQDLEFISEGPPSCAALAKTELNGKRARLSGESPYNGLVLPLAKAHDYARSLFPVAKRKEPFRGASLAACVAVLEAPMFLVQSDRPDEPQPCPWVRVCRQEARIPESLWERSSKYYYVDVVHFGFLAEYLDAWLIPFADEFGRRVSAVNSILVTGASVPDLDSWSWRSLSSTPEAD